MIYKQNEIKDVLLSNTTKGTPKGCNTLLNQYLLFNSRKSSHYWFCGTHVMMNREESLQLYTPLERKHGCKWRRSVHGGRGKKTTVNPREVEWELCCVQTLVSPHKHVLKSKPPGQLVLGAIRALWQVRGPDGGPLLNRISASERRLQRAPSPPTGQNEGAWLWTRPWTSLDRPGAASLVLVSQPPQPRATHFCPCHLPRFCHVAMAACTEQDGSLARLSRTT